MKKKKPPVLLITALLVLLAGGALVNQIIGKAPTPDAPVDPGPVAAGDIKPALDKTQIKNIVNKNLAPTDAKPISQHGPGGHGGPQDTEVTSPMILTDDPLQARAIEHPAKGLPSDNRTSAQWYRAKSYTGRHADQ
jgi:hypothetical protein